jgi:hypothetical protein
VVTGAVVIGEDDGVAVEPGSVDAGTVIEVMAVVVGAPDPAFNMAEMVVEPGRVGFAPCGAKEKVTKEFCAQRVFA